MSVIVSGTFDIECEAWDKYVIGGCYDGSEYFSTRDIGELLDYMLQRGGTWWGHYSGAYDQLAILSEHAKRKDSEKVRLFMAGSRITCAAFGRKLLLRDSYAIAPTTLEKFATLIGERKTEPDLPCICGEQCKGYCSIKRSMSAANYRKVDSYMQNDCVVLFKALTYWLDFLRDNFGEPKGTVGASAFSFTKQGPAKWDSALYSFSQKGYFGGRTEVWKRESPIGSSGRWAQRMIGKSIAPKMGGWHDDINSAYVDALRLPMPVGPAKETRKTIPSTAKFWIAEADVTVKQTHIPPLPIKRDNRLFYPYGRFFGTWNSTELLAAVADGYAQINSIGRVVYWEAEDYPYVEYCNHIWQVRHNAGKDTVSGKLIKQVAVSVCGKLAQRPEMREVIYSPEPIIGMMPIDDSCRFWESKKFRIADCAHVHHAGAMTAHVRVRVRRRGDKAGTGAVYCDTDSVFSEVFIPDDIGFDLGEWLPSDKDKGHDGTYYDFEALAPKLYRYKERKDEFRAKGFSLGSDNPGKRFDRVVRGEKVTITRGVYPLLRALRFRDTIFERRNETKQFHKDAKWCGGRLKVGAFETRPPSIEEVHERIRKRED